MKSKKFLPAFIAALVFLLGNMNALAATAKFLENFYVNEANNTFVILSSPTISTSGSPAAERLNITLSGEEIAVTGISGFGASGLPITYCCLVDISGSMNSAQMQQAKDALLTIVDNMKDNDNMAVATLGTQVGQYEFTADKEKLRETINSLQAIKTEDTNLYAGIVSSISTLKTGGDVNLKRCLVILSDGMDDQLSGYTHEEAVRAVSDGGVPVYTVATLRGAEQAESGKVLGEFARLSPGGGHYVPVIDGITGADAGYSVAASINSGYIISTDISSLDTGLRDEILLRVQAGQEDSSLLEDTATLFAADLPRVMIGEPEPPKTEEPDEDDEDDEDDKDDKPDRPESNLPKLIAIAAAALTIGLIALVAVKRKNENNSPEPTPEPEPIPEPVPDPTPVPVPLPDRNTAGITVRFTMIGGTKNSAEKTVSFFLPEGAEKTIGRDNRADFILNAGDMRLSGVNSKLLYSKGRLYLSDAASRNGTVYNGVPLHVERTAVEKDGKLRAGSCEYRINW